MKSIRKIFLVMFAAMLCSYASAKSGKPKIEYTVESSHDMDANWEQYFSTGDETYLDNIFAYVDSEDLLISKINNGAKKFLKDEKFVQAMSTLGADVEGGKFNLIYDLEMMTGFFLKDQDFSEPLKYIYSFFPNDLFIRGVMKNTAFWSLMSNAEQYDEINIAVQKRIPYLNEKAQGSFSIYTGDFEKIALIKSADGAAEFNSERIHIMPVLVNDIDKTLEQWNSLDSEEMPVIKSSSDVNLKKGTDSISPFIVFNANENLECPLYYDCELIKPDGTKSSYGHKKLSLVSKEPQNRNYLYAADQYYTWIFDKSDASGKYTVRISVYSAKKVLCIFEMNFKLTK